MVGPVGPLVIVGTGGGVVSTVHANEATLVSAVALVARTSKVCCPSPRFEKVCPETQGA